MMIGLWPMASAAGDTRPRAARECWEERPRAQAQRKPEQASCVASYDITEVMKTKEHPTVADQQNQHDQRPADEQPMALCQIAAQPVNQQPVRDQRHHGVTARKSGVLLHDRHVFKIRPRALEEHPQPKVERETRANRAYPEDEIAGPPPHP